MSQRLVRIGLHVINLDALANCHWEGRKLVVRYLGGGFEMLEGKDARSMWHLVGVGVICWPSFWVGGRGRGVGGAGAGLRVRGGGRGDGRGRGASGRARGSRRA